MEEGNNEMHSSTLNEVSDENLTNRPILLIKEPVKMEQSTPAGISYQDETLLQIDFNGAQLQEINTAEENYPSLVVSSGTRFSFNCPSNEYTPCDAPHKYPPNDMSQNESPSGDTSLNHLLLDNASQNDRALDDVSQKDCSPSDESHNEFPPGDESPNECPPDDASSNDVSADDVLKSVFNYYSGRRRGNAVKSQIRNYSKYSNISSIAAIETNSDNDDRLNFIKYCKTETRNLSVKSEMNFYRNENKETTDENRFLYKIRKSCVDEGYCDVCLRTDSSSNHSFNEIKTINNNFDIKNTYNEPGLVEKHFRKPLTPLNCADGSRIGNSSSEGPSGMYDEVGERNNDSHSYFECTEQMPRDRLNSAKTVKKPDTLKIQNSDSFTLKGIASSRNSASGSLRKGKIENSDITSTSNEPVDGPLTLSLLNCAEHSRNCNEQSCPEVFSRTSHGEDRRKDDIYSCPEYKKRLSLAEKVNKPIIFKNQISDSSAEEICVASQIG